MEVIRSKTAMRLKPRPIAQELLAKAEPKPRPKPCAATATRWHSLPNWFDEYWITPRDAQAMGKTWAMILAGGAKPHAAADLPIARKAIAEQATLVRNGDSKGWGSRYRSYPAGMCVIGGRPGIHLKAGSRRQSEEAITAMQSLHRSFTGLLWSRGCARLLS